MNKKKHFQGLEQLHPTEVSKQEEANEFRENLPFEDVKAILNAPTPRRDFLKYLGFSTAAAIVAASCEMPVRKAITWAVKPNDITPGVPLFYASTFVDAGDAIPVVVKTREARPIKIEGNTLSKITEGGTSARVQASVLGLYDTFRLTSPRINNAETSWEAVDNAVIEAIKSVGNAPIYLMSSTIISNSVLEIISKFTTKYPNIKHVQYDAISYSGLLDANAKNTGKRAIPSYKFDVAKTIVSIGADFLGTWISPVEYSRQYSKTRKITKFNPTLSKHYQIEANMSITGGVADERVTCRPSEYGAVAVALLAALNGTTSTFSSKKLNETISNAAKDLKAGNGLVVCGSNDTSIQEVVNAINAAIGAYGKTINTTISNNTKKGNDAELAMVVAALQAGTVGGLMFADCNPAYDTYAADIFSKAIPSLKLSVSFNERNDETSQKCKILAPVNHWLESWGDAEIKTGYISFQQPTINPLFKTRPFAENLLKWSGDNTSYHDYFLNAWTTKLRGNSGFDKAIQNGVIEPETEIIGGSYSGSVADAIAKILSVKPVSGFELIVYENVGIGRGASWSNNAWLQEMPDPVTKCTWDNYLCMSPAKAKELGAEETDINEVQRDKKVFKVTLGKNTVNLPVAVVPGMNNDTVAIAVGYGRNKEVGNAAKSDDSQGGKNAYPFLVASSTGISFSNPVTVDKTNDTYPLAITQTHHSYEGRESVVKEYTLAEYAKNPNVLYDERMEELEHFTHDFDSEDHTSAEGASENENQKVKVDGDKVEINGEEHDIEKLYRKNGTLYPVYESLGLKWGMSIDLNSCTGCGACTIACQAENNISVVGKEQIIKVHDMNWLRIDRYYASTTADPFDSDSIQTVFMPMLCQHCDNAPCENVCPVNATNHSSEGLNQMVYNRCIGTRYCANNCPFKVRRFNWRDWNGADSFADNLFTDGHRDDINSDLTRMVLNPDVTVRSRGVMEKCTFCVQRLQGAKTKAKSENREMADGEANSACAQACPTNAIVFGNVNDKESAISKIRNEGSKERLYYALEEIHVLPNVNYLSKIRNTTEAGAPKEVVEKSETIKQEHA